MKKFIACFLFIFIGLSCTKETAPILCGCSPAPPLLSLVIRSANGADLLDAAVAGAYQRNDIRLFYREGNGTEKQVEFFIRPPFGYGNDGAKFNFHQISIANLASINRSPDDLYYLKLSGSETPETLRIKMNTTTNQVGKVTINGIDNPVETSLPQAYGIIYSLVK
ncbi:hypothetical protein GZH53_19315 [Flavihumibacter sp. R14]|nr:hypothetical protein [Flavihumibacter soli]